MAAKTIVGRLICDTPASGSWNMAIDAAILEFLKPDDPPTLRFYRWAKPTLSLGYFQSVSSRDQHEHSRHCDIVRRATGGGAILHNRELTYSLTIPTASQSTGASPWIYQTIHQAVIQALHAAGIIANRFGLPQVSPPLPEPFLCFQRRTAEDLIVSGYKILGSAQRRSQAGVLQHGSLLLSASRYAPQLPGLVELIGADSKSNEGIEIVIERLYSKLAAGITAQLAKELKLTWTPRSLRLEEQELASRIERERFGNSAWTGKR